MLFYGPHGHREMTSFMRPFRIQWKENAKAVCVCLPCVSKVRNGFWLNLVTARVYATEYFLLYPVIKKNGSKGLLPKSLILHYTWLSYAEGDSRRGHSIFQLT
jgi:hypothetical protein